MKEDVGIKKLHEVIKDAPQDEDIRYAMTKTLEHFKNHNCALVAVSGGADSDIMLDILYQCDVLEKCRFVWFDTGLEYEATKKHLQYLECTYNITIHREKAIKSVAASCKQFGQPFLSKLVSDYMSRLQRHNFQWEDEPFDVLIKKYPKCKSALKWWCNESKCNAYNICQNKLLKEFIIKHPPKFKISDKCCKYAKKDMSNLYIKNHKEIDMLCIGVRKAEGGTRKNISSCFSTRSKNGIDIFRPIFWFKDSTKSIYKKHYNIKHSDCYELYGMKRTGCCGCPFGRKRQQELEIANIYDHKLAEAVRHIFSDSYLYDAAYMEYKKQKNI